MLQDLPADPAKLARMFWPLYVLIALSVLVNPSAWWPLSATDVFLLSTPGLFLLMGWAVRRRWRLEVTPEALLHHTLTRTERYEWARMGPVGARWIHVGHVPVARTLWFPYPTDAPRTVEERITARLGRRLLPVFGDRPLQATAEQLEQWRGLLTEPAGRRSTPASAPGRRR